MIDLHKLRVFGCDQRIDARLAAHLMTEQMRISGELEGMVARDL